MADGHLNIFRQWKMFLIDRNADAREWEKVRICSFDGAQLKIVQKKKFFGPIVFQQQQQQQQQQKLCWESYFRILFCVLVCVERNFICMFKHLNCFSSFEFEQMKHILLTMGQWLWLCWQSRRFLYQKAVVPIQSLAKFYEDHINNWKD